MTQDKPTIEDVLDRNGIGGAHWSYRNSVIAAMTEWASLQTPSNEKYWRERCEAAELNITTYSDWNTDRLDVDRISSTADVLFLKWKNAFDNWQQLKSTPIPIQTPCVGQDYKLAPEETELIDVWRQARAAVKNSKFSIADERLEHCKRILGESGDYWMPLPTKPNL